MVLFGAVVCNCVVVGSVHEVDMERTVALSILLHVRTVSIIRLSTNVDMELIDRVTIFKSRAKVIIVSNRDRICGAIASTPLVPVLFCGGCSVWWR